MLAFRLGSFDAANLLDRLPLDGKRVSVGSSRRGANPMRWIRMASAAAGLAFLPSAASAQEVVGRALRPIEVDPATVATPQVRFTETDADRSGYAKYFYFVREDTDFATAYRDIRECDALARGMTYYAGRVDAPYPYAGMFAGAMGGAIGSAMADAIYGSAERRQMRRSNLRTCMGYKGYSRYGLNKYLWEQFNFEEGNRTVPEDQRQKYLQLQAKAAIAGRASGQELGF
jgi:hypothetical protein